LKPPKLLVLNKLNENKFIRNTLSDFPFKMVIIKGKYCNFSYAPIN
jgi:hypothetical protein